MKYDAITLDTNIFRDNGYRLESGLLAQLAQFKTSATKFVLSEIVHRELRRHLLAEVDRRREALLLAAKKARRAGLIPPEHVDALMSICEAAASPVDVVDSRLSHFSQDTGMTLLSVANVTAAELFEGYFAISPPFEAFGDKKKEFPDAAALTSLDHWARDHQLRLLAVTRDRGWADFAVKSDHIAVQPTLGEALSLFQEQHTQAYEFVVALLQATAGGKAQTFRLGLEEAVADSLAELDVDADFSTDETVSSDTVKLTLGTVRLTGRDNNQSFAVVRAGSKSVVFTMLITAEFSAETAVQFIGTVYDRGDEYIYEDDVITAESWFESDLLVELDTEGLFPMLKSIELIHPPTEVDFGHVESWEHAQAQRG